ncbi:hypothetical protein T492DRAFT_1018657 [Pavlovales sp. CCMP2436]|nr:hypothetical protein T492DRAFT_1018657 [Pavlovales sp. CCMP2436]
MHPIRAQVSRGELSELLRRADLLSSCLGLEPAEEDGALQQCLFCFVCFMFRYIIYNYKY